MDSERGLYGPVQARHVARGCVALMGVHMRIMLVTDAWDPQVNGVVRTMKRVIAESEAMRPVLEMIDRIGKSWSIFRIFLLLTEAR